MKFLNSPFGSLLEACQTHHIAAQNLFDVRLNAGDRATQEAKPESNYIDTNFAYSHTSELLNSLIQLV